MPVEIKELHIRVTVSGKPAEAAKKTRNAAAKGEAHSADGTGKDEIVAECVEQVLEILRVKRER